MIARAITNVIDDDCSAPAVVTAGFLQDVSSSEERENAAPGRMTAGPTFLLCPLLPPLSITFRPLHLLDPRTANALVAGDSTAHLYDPAMNGGVLMVVWMATASALIDVL